MKFQWAKDTVESEKISDPKIPEFMMILEFMKILVIANMKQSTKTFNNGYFFATFKHTWASEWMRTASFINRRNLVCWLIGESLYLIWRHKMIY